MRPFAMAALLGLVLLCVVSAAAPVDIPRLDASLVTARIGRPIENAAVEAKGFHSAAVAPDRGSSASRMETEDVLGYQTFKYAAGYPSPDELILVADGETITDGVYFPALYSGLEFPIGDPVDLQIGRASDSEVLWEASYPITASEYPYMMASVRLETVGGDPVFWTNAFTLTASAIDPALEESPVLVVFSLIGPEFPYDVILAPKVGEGEPGRLVEDGNTFFDVSSVTIRELDDEIYWDCYIYLIDPVTANTTGVAEATFEPGRVYYMIWTEYADENGYSPIIQYDTDAGSFVTPGGLLTTAALAMAALFASRQH